MKESLVMGCILCLGAAGAFGGEVFSRGAYVGGVVGQSEFDDDGAFSDLGYYYDVELDDTATSFGAYGGYRFFRYFSVEGRLVNFGSFALKDDYESVDIDALALTANAVGIIPFGESGWEIFGQLGAGGIHFEVDGGWVEEDSDEVVATAGVGIRFTPIRNLSIALQFDAYAWESDSRYDPFISTAQLGVQYNFARSTRSSKGSYSPKVEEKVVYTSAYEKEVDSIGQGMMCNDSTSLVRETDDTEIWKLDCGDGETLEVHCIEGTCYVK